MKKKLRLRISRMISSFQTCREKKSASALPPVFCLSPSNPKKLDIEFPSPTPPPAPRPSPSRRIAAVVASTAGCRSCAPTMPSLSPAVDIGADDMSRARESPAYLWRKEEKWHVVTCAEEFERRRRKIDDCDDVEDDDLFPADVRKLAARRKREVELRRRRRCRKPKAKGRNSTSSVASGSWFSSDDDEQNDEREDGDDNDYDDDTDTLLSSRSFSTDYEPRFRRFPSPEAPSPRSSSSSMLSRMVACGVLDDGVVKVKESFAVVKKSEDPRGDFRRSMAEMVVEKGMYDAADLEQLLHCFLSLNSRQHHRAIVSAFADVWEALFPSETSPRVAGC